MKQFATSKRNIRIPHRNIIRFIDIVTSKSCEHIESTLTEVSLRKDRQEKYAKIEENTELNGVASAAAKTNAYHPYDMSRCGNLYLVFEYVEVMCTVSVCLWI